MYLYQLNKLQIKQKSQLDVNSGYFFIKQLIINYYQFDYTVRMQNQKYNIGFQNECKQMHSSNFFDQNNIGRINQIILTPTLTNLHNSNMRSSIMNNYQSRKLQNLGFESPRTSYTNHQSQQLAQNFNKTKQQTKDFNLMSKNYLRKQSICDNTLDIWAYVKQLQTRITKINQTLYNHEYLLNEKSQWGDSRSTISNNSLTEMNYDSFQRDIVGIIQKQLQKELKKIQGSIFQQNERINCQLRQQIETVKKEEFEYFLKKIENETVSFKREISKDITEFRQAKFLQKKNFHELFNKEFDGKIIRFHQASREAFKRIQFNFLEINQILEAVKAQNLLLKISVDQINQANLHNNQFFISNKKFHDPKLIKYKQILEVGGENFNNFNNSNRSTKQIIINQVNYYVDREGYLLDKECYYLLDKSGKQIQFQDKQLNILKIFNILY